MENGLNKLARNSLQKEHEQSYWRLYLHRDGSISWSEYADSNGYAVDLESRPILELVCAGTGSIECHCELCKGESAYDSPEDINFEDCAPGSLDARAELLKHRIQEVAVGYFDDEHETSDEG
jgi:hypothetical protein